MPGTKLDRTCLQVLRIVKSFAEGEIGRSKQVLMFDDRDYYDHPTLWKLGLKAWGLLQATDLPPKFWTPS